MVSFKSEVIFSLFGFPVTNTVTTTILVDLVILTLIAVLNRGVSLKPGRLQIIFETIMEYFYSLTE